MTWVVLALRKQELKSRMNNLQSQIIDIQKETMNLQNYGSAIADGVITPDEAASMSSKYYGTLLDFSLNSSNAAYMSAGEKTDAYIRHLQEQSATTGKQYNYTVEDMTIQPAILFNEVYKQELAEYAKLTTERINQMEKELESKKLTLETQLKMVQAEYDSLSGAVDGEIQKSAPRYA